MSLTRQWKPATANGKASVPASPTLQSCRSSREGRTMSERSMTALNLRIAIVGYGVAGIAAAIFLRRQGHEVTHFEQAENPSPIGAGFLMQSTGLAVLGALNLADGALARGAKVEQ